MSSRRRPVLRNAGVVACLLVVAACTGGDVAVDAPALEGPTAHACDRLVDALPDTLDDQPRRSVDPPDAPGAAWGDPPIVLHCGVDRPARFDELSLCQIANGVAWFIPQEQITGEPADIVMTAVDRRPRVEVRLPAAYWPPAAAMAKLAGPLKRTTERADVCR